MKTQISRISHQPLKRYSAIYQQQGRMITDADWNELTQITNDRLQHVLTDIIGNGLPRDQGLRLIEDATDVVRIEPGHIYVEGVFAELYGEQAIAFVEQDDFPDAVLPQLDGTSDFLLYADVWEHIVTALQDRNLSDAALNGADTCTRSQTLVQIKWCPQAINPEDESQNPKQGNALCSLAIRENTTIKDSCDPCASELSVEQERIGNYLFRLEVHDVTYNSGSPARIVLKWSAENGAEQYAVGEEPESFIGDWIYEFYNDTSEKHLGLHHLDTAQGIPFRFQLEEGYPEDLSSYQGAYVRRWDGYCVLELNGTWTLVQGKDDVNELSADPAKTGQDGFVNIDNGKLQMLLGSRPLVLTLELNSNIFIAGDFWQVPVREKLHQAGSTVMENETPTGIVHHYLKLATLKGDGTLVPCDTDSECRRAAFPPLTDLHAHDIAYSDPGCGEDNSTTPPSPTVRSLLSNAINNWIDIDQDKRNTVKDVLDALLCHLDAAKLPYNPVIQQARWEDILENPPAENLPTNVQQAIDDLLGGLESSDITYSIINCAGPGPHLKDLLGLAGTTDIKTLWDTLLCNLDASRLPYNPNHSPATGARWGDVNEEEGSTTPQTVQQAIDALLANLNSEDITYLLPDCNPDTNTLKHYIQGDITHDARDGSDRYRISALWNALMCHLDAAKLPVDRNVLCTYLKNLKGNEQVNTVQDAINALCQRKQDGGGCCTVTIAPGDDLQARLSSALVTGMDAHICITEGQYTISQSILIEGLGHITIEGCGNGTIIQSTENESAFVIRQCKSVSVRNLAMSSQKLGHTQGSEHDHLNGTLTIRDVEDVVVEGVSLSCAHGARKMATCLTVTHNLKSASVRIRDCKLKPGHQQVGALVVNTDLARINDNEVKARTRSGNSSLSKLLKNRDFRLSIRKIMISDIVVTPDPTTADENKNVVLAYEGRQIIFTTHRRLTKVWPDYFQNRPIEKNLNDRDLVRYLVAQADDILLTLATDRNISPGNPLDRFIPWFSTTTSNLPAIACQGIVCGGKVANDICLTGNSIYGVSQGIHIGLSHNDGTDNKKTYHAGRLSVTGNRIVNYLSEQIQGERHGIYIGNFKCLHIENNQLKLEKFPRDLETNVNGIRTYGFFGNMMQLRGNCLNGYRPGIYARALNTPAPRLWQVENNILEGSSAPDIQPAAKFITTNNPH